MPLGGGGGGGSVRDTGMQLVRGAWGRLLVGKDRGAALLSTAKDRVTTGAAAASTGIASITYAAGARVRDAVGGRGGGQQQQQPGGYDYDGYGRNGGGGGDAYSGYQDSYNGRSGGAYGRQPYQDPRQGGRQQQPPSPYGRGPAAGDPRQQGEWSRADSSGAMQQAQQRQQQQMGGGGGGGSAGRYGAGNGQQHEGFGNGYAPPTQGAAALGDYGYDGQWGGGGGSGTDRGSGAGPRGVPYHPQPPQWQGSQ